MDNNTNSELLEAASEIYNQNVADIKKGLYGKYIKTNDDGTFLVQDAVLSKTLKIVDNIVLWTRTGFPEQYSKWLESIPAVSIKDSRHEQKFFENISEMSSVNELFKSPDYSYSAKNKVAIVKYMTPMEYIKKVAKGFNITLEKQMQQIGVKDVVKYAADMSKGDLFPIPYIMYFKDGSIDQEGRHRAMAVQYLIDTGKIPEDTLIPVVIVTEV